MTETLHHSITVTSCYRKEITDVHQFAEQLGLIVSPLADEQFGCSSFCVFPDGSSEGWATSNEMDERRKVFKDVLRMTEHKMEWVEVSFGHYDRPAHVEDEGNYIR